MALNPKWKISPQIVVPEDLLSTIIPPPHRAEGLPPLEV
jgi:hypothetical protein